MSQSKTIIVIFVSALLFAGQAVADFGKCFGPCALGCALASDKLQCGSKCLFKCIVGETSAKTSDIFCKIGCAIDRCTKFVDDVNKLGDCVKECENGRCSIALSPASQETHQLDEEGERL